MSHRANSASDHVSCDVEPKRRADEPGAQYTIAQAENPVIEVTRTADKTNAKPGEKVTITYTIKNTTKFDMTDITLIDEMSAIARSFRTKPSAPAEHLLRLFLYYGR
jgi:uncharacterized repeat protein (TIGR01451 family)